MTPFNVKHNLLVFIIQTELKIKQKLVLTGAYLY